MSSKFTKIVIGLFFTFLAMSYFVYAKWPDEYVHIVFCDVGQGDSLLIYQGFSQILIDSGPDTTVLSCLNSHLPFWDRKIELVVATHYDSDHIGGLESVFDFYDIASVLTLPFASDTNNFETLKEALEESTKQGLIIEKPFLGQTMRFSSGVMLTVVSHLSSDRENMQFLQEKLALLGAGEMNTLINTSQFAAGNEVKNSVLTEKGLSDSFFRDETSGESKNDLSIALLLTYHNTKILLTGDMEKKGEEAMEAQGLTSQVNILKVGHHGSKSSSDPGFIKELRPEFAVVSVGKNNKYDHPSTETLEILSLLGVRIMRTDQLGDREVITDGKKYWFPEK